MRTIVAIAWYPNMKIKGLTALVTGANRGLGRTFVQALRDAGCTKIYAAARTIEGAACDAVVEPVQLDITKIGQVSSAATRCHDVSILINNAGVARFVPVLGAPTMDDARLEIETNYLGTLAMCRAFAPVLKRNGGGALVNMLSVVSFFNAPMQGSYCASKAAEWSLTKAVRFELRAQGTLVIGVYAGYIDTDMTTGLMAPKSSPGDIAARRHRERYRRYPRRRTLARGVCRTAQGRPCVRCKHAKGLGQPARFALASKEIPLCRANGCLSLRKSSALGPACVKTLCGINAP
jgi:NAD(P)-dependent dehydrogenase (short-subunit alcohol dehydrogenase family)